MRGLVEIGNKKILFILQSAYPQETLTTLLIFFQERSIQIEAASFQTPAGNIFIHCLIEKDRVRRTVHLLQTIPKIMTIQWLELKGEIQN